MIITSKILIFVIQVLQCVTIGFFILLTMSFVVQYFKTFLRFIKKCFTCSIGIHKIVPLECRPVDENVKEGKDDFLRECKYCNKKFNRF